MLKLIKYMTPETLESFKLDLEAALFHGDPKDTEAITMLNMVYAELHNVTGCAKLEYSEE